MDSKPPAYDSDEVSAPQQNSAYTGYPPPELYPPQPQGSSNGSYPSAVYPPQQMYPPQQQMYPPQSHPPQPYPAQQQGVYNQHVYPDGDVEPLLSSESHQYGSDSDLESGDEPMFKSNISECTINARHGFIRKVYFIVLLQLIITGAIMAAHLFVPQVRNFTARHALPLFYIYFAVSLFCLIFLMCVESARKRSPHNLILLFVFTLSEAGILSFIAISYTADEIILAVGITAFLVFGCTLFACQTKWDFTGLGPYLFTFLWGMLLFGLLMMFFHNDTVNLVYCCLGAILFMFYIIFDTQLIIGGKNHSFSEEEYIIAAINLYLDIVNLFLYILRIFSKR